MKSGLGDKVRSSTGRQIRLWLFLAVLVALNFLGTVFHDRIDLTAENRYTLTRPTVKLLKGLREPVRVTVFLKGTIPSGFRKLSSETGDLLFAFRDLAGKNIQFSFVDPEEKPEGSTGSIGDSLSAMGLLPINLTSQIKSGSQQSFVYPYALVSCGEKTTPVILFPESKKILSAADINEASALLEYRFADAIYRSVHPERPVIAYSISNEEPRQEDVYDLVENVLKPNFDLFTFDMDRVYSIPDTFRAMLIVKPRKPFSEEQKLKLDQYVMRGGNLLFFIDRLDAEMDSLQIKNEVIAYDRDLDIYDLLFRYGVRVNPDLIMDLQCDDLPFDVSGNGQFELLPWNYFPVLQSARNHSITRNLGFVSGRFVNSLDTVEADGIRKTILLTSSSNARTIGSPTLISGKENVIAPEDERFRKKDIPAAVLLEGRFRSLYANRISGGMRDTLAAYGISFLQEGIKPARVLVAGDGDLLLNSVKGNEPLPMGRNPFTYGTQREYPFANRNFIENVLDFMVNEGGLNEAKEKEIKLPLLNTARVRKERSFWVYFNLLLPPLLLLIFGLAFRFAREKRYAKSVKT